MCSDVCERAIITLLEDKELFIEKKTSRHIKKINRRTSKVAKVFESKWFEFRISEKKSQISQNSSMDIIQSQ